MIKSYLLKPRFSSFDVKKWDFFTTSKTLINQDENGTWFLNQFNKINKLTIKKEVKGEDVYTEKIIDNDLAERLKKQSKNNSVTKNVYSIKLPNIEQKTKLEYYYGALRGLVVMSVYFKNEEEYKKFKMPSYAIREITNEDYYGFINLSKLTFEDIEKKENFERFYKKVQTQVGID